MSLYLSKLGKYWIATPSPSKTSVGKQSRFNCKQKVYFLQGKRMSNIPKLRFKEFSGEWNTTKVGKVSNKIVAGGTPSTLQSDYWNNGNIRWMSSGELNYKKVYEVQKRITELGLTKSSTKIIPKNCILIGLAGQGKTRGTIAMNMIELCINQSIAAIHPNDKVFDENFLYHNLDNRYDELRRLSAGEGGRGGLNLQIIKTLDLTLPTKPEQQKIASFLTSVDKKIELLTRKEKLLKDYKKSLMQKIFSKEIRFKDDGGSKFPEWVEKKLGDIATFYNSKRVPLTESDRIAGKYPYYGASGVIDYVKEYLFDGEYILLGEDGANIVMRNSRLVFLAKGRFWVNNHAHIFQAKDSNVFLCEALERINYTKYNTGTAQPKLNSDVVKKITLALPTKPEQQKIASFLTSVDKKIEQVAKQLEHTKEFKKGLLQQMFM